MPHFKLPLIGIFAYLTLGAIAPTNMGMGIGGGQGAGGAPGSPREEELLSLGLNANGIGSLAEFTNKTGLTPAWLWFGDNPLTSVGSTGGALTLAAGSTSSLATPFCPAGNWSDLSACQQGRVFPGSAAYVTSDNHTLSGDVTIVALINPSIDLAGDSYYFSSNQATGDGIELLSKVSQPCASAGDFASGTSTTAIGVSKIGTWQLCAVVIDDTNNTYKGWLNGSTSSNTGTFSGNTWTPGAEPFVIGARTSAGGTSYTGQIAWIAQFNSALTSAQLNKIADAAMGITPLQNSVWETNRPGNGNQCCWVDGKMSCFSYSWPMMGCETSAVTATSSGALMMDNDSENLLSTRVLTSNWTEIGTGVIQSVDTANSPFRDGRGVYPIVDDDAAAAEGIYQMSTAAFGTQTHVWAKAAVNGTKLDLVATEHTGGSCPTGGSTPTTQYAAVTLTTSYQLFSFSFTRTNSNCSQVRWNFYVGDAATVTDTGIVYAIFNNLGATTTAPIYVEATSGAVGYGGNLIRWDNVLSFNFATNKTYTLDAKIIPYTTSVATGALTPVIFYMDDGNGTPTSFVGLNFTATDDIVGTNGTNAATYTTYAATALTPTWIRYEFNYNTDIYTLYTSADGITYTQRAQNTTAVSAPTGLDSVGIGATSTPARRMSYPTMVSNIRLTSTKP